MKDNLLLIVMIASAVSCIISCHYSNDILLVSGCVSVTSALLFGNEVSKDEDE